MSGKLDQSLDQIMQDTKPAGGRPGRRDRKPRVAKNKAKAAITAPTGGVQKRAPAPKPTTMGAPRAPAPSAQSKIIVSNLPEDVTETQIKDYFGQTIGFVQRVILTYGPNGRSRGNATIIFRKGDAGQKAVKQLDGVKVDGKPMRIELIVSATEVPKAPAPKGLADRMSKPKSAAKEKDKPKANGATTAKGPTTAKAKKPARSGRPKKKTAAELDAEMVDYFGVSGEGAAPAQPAAATNGADAMVDEVL